MVSNVISYASRRLVFLGVEMIVHVAPGTPDERVEATLATMLLSDLAHALRRW